MTLRKKVLTGSAVLTSGQACGQALSLVRNIIVARLLSPEDVGIAATFWVVVSLLEMVSDLAADRLIIQAKNGDDPRLQATAQFWQFMRGVISAAMICLLAHPAVMLFGVPQAEWAFYWMALVPLLRGMLHLDVKRLQRQMRFGPAVSIEVGSQLLAVAVAWPMTRWAGDYSAVLWLAVVQFGTLVIGSHLWAERPYRWAWDREHARRLLSFGWPLLVNGVLMFGIFQGDRLIIGAAYSMHELGVYAVAAMLVMPATTIMASAMGSLILPVLARVQDDQAQFQRRYTLCIQSIALVCGVAGIILIVAGGPVVILVFGQEYASASVFIGWLVAVQAVRQLRIGPTIAALACGDSLNSMLANLCRSGALVPMILVAWVGAPLVWIVIAGCLGEIVALLFSSERLWRRKHMPKHICLVPSLLAGLAMGAAGLITLAGIPANGWLSIAAVSSGLIAMLLMVALMIFPDLRNEMRHAAQLMTRRNLSLSTDRS